MTQPHRYEYDITPGSAPDRVVNMVGSSKKVLELGSGPGTITRKLSANDCQVIALEIDSSAIEIVSNYCESVYQCDFNNKNSPESFPNIGEFDVLVAADVFEHLYDPWNCVKELHRFLAANGSLVVSILHIGHAAIMACLLRSDFEYHSWGLLDKTHIRFFGLKNIQSLFEDAGFKIIEVEFIVTAPELTELARHWKKTSKTTQQALLAGKFSNIYQTVLRAVPIASRGQALNLELLIIPPTGKVSTTDRLRNSWFWNYLISLIPPETRNRVRKMFKGRG